MKREKNLEARQKELKQKAKREAAQKKGQATEETHDANADMPEIEEAFFKAVNLDPNADDSAAPPADPEGDNAAE